jgi:hypothetical protein
MRHEAYFKGLLQGTPQHRERFLGNRRRPMLLNVVILCGVIACAVVCSFLWWSLGAVSSVAAKILLALLGALIGYVVYFLLQTGWEKLHPEARAPNGDILAYYVQYFSAALAVIVIAMFFARRTA